MTDTAALPPGFVEEEEKLPALPKGFVLEGGEPPMSEANKALQGTGLSVSEPKKPEPPAQLGQPRGTTVGGDFKRMDPVEKAQFEKTKNLPPGRGPDPYEDRQAAAPMSTMDQIQGGVGHVLSSLNPWEAAKGLYGTAKGAYDKIANGDTSYERRPPDYARADPLSEAESNAAAALLMSKSPKTGPRPSSAGFRAPTSMSEAFGGEPKPPSTPGSPGVVGKAVRWYMNKKAPVVGGMAYDAVMGEGPTQAPLPTRQTRPLGTKPPAAPKPPSRAEAALQRQDAITQNVPSGTSLGPQGASLPAPTGTVAPAAAEGKSVWGTPILQDLNSPPAEPVAPNPQPNGTLASPIAGTATGGPPTWAPPELPETATPTPTRSGNRVPDAAATPPAPPAATPMRSTNRVPDVPAAAPPAATPVVPTLPPGPGSIPGKGKAPTWRAGTIPEAAEVVAEEAKPSTQRKPETKPTTEKPKPDAAKAAKELADEMGVEKIESTETRSRADKRDITTVNKFNAQRADAARLNPEAMKGTKAMTLEEFKALSPEAQKAINDRMKEMAPVPKTPYRRPVKKLGLGGVIQTISAAKPTVGRRSRRGIWYGPPPVPARRKI